jgi:hypothetical protein
MESIWEFLRPTRRKVILFAVFVALDHLMARYCWDLLPLPLRCPPGIHVFLTQFGYVVYLFVVYLAASLIVYLSHLIWSDRI